MHFFYFDQTNQKRGPVSRKQLKELAARGIIGAHTPMETDTGHKGVAGQIPGLFATTPVPHVQSESSIYSNPMSENIQSLFKWFWIWGVVTVSAIVFGMLTIGISGILFEGEEIAFFLFLVVFGGVAVAVGGAFSVFPWTCITILHYLLWMQIPRNIARTTPLKATLLLFIPLFQFYWMFVSIKGLVEDMNTSLHQRGVQYQVNNGIFLTFFTLASLSILSWAVFLIATEINSESESVMLELILTLITLSLSIVTFITGSVLYKSIKDGAIALLEQEGT